MTQPNLDNSVRAFYYQILLLSSKASASTDVSDVVEKFYDRHYTSELAVLEIDSILQSVGIYKIGKEGRESYIFKRNRNRIAAEDSARILNAGISVISRILYRDQLQRKISCETNRDSAMELKSEIQFLNQEINNRVSRQNLLLMQLRRRLISDTLSAK